MAPISIKRLRSKDPLLQACGFYKPFEVDLYNNYVFEHKVGHLYDGWNNFSNMHVTLCKWWITTDQIFQKSRKLREKYCHFYGDQSHSIEDCFALIKQIKELIKQGRLQRFLGKDRREDRPPVAYHQRPPTARPGLIVGEIHMIIGGMAARGISRSSRKAYTRQIHMLVT